jgi:ATP-dependent Lhr-like helicase
MTFILANTEIKPAVLAQNILNLYAFREITVDDFKTLLYHMLEIGHLQQLENGNLIIGLAAQSLVSGYYFYGVFETSAEYNVKYKGETIGSVTEAYPVGTNFSLAGKSWKTTGIDEKSKIIFVEAVSGISSTNWVSTAQMDLHTKVLQKMQEILICDEQYAYLSQSCKERLEQFRLDTRLSGIAGELAVELNGDNNSFAVFPWVGTRELYTLVFALKKCGITAEICPGEFLPVYLEVEFNGSLEDLTEAVKKLLAGTISKYDFDLPDKIQIPSKFNRYIPNELLKKEFVEDYLV